MGLGQNLLNTPTLLSGAYVVMVAPPTGVAATDTAAIQAALNAAPPGGRVQLQPGSYLVSGLTLPSFVTIQGAGPKLTKLLASANSTTLISIAGTSGTPTTYTTIRDLGFVANTFTGVTAIGGTYWNLSTVDNVWSSQVNWFVNINNSTYVHVTKYQTDELIQGFYLRNAVNFVISDSSLSGTTATAVLGVQIDSGCDGAELHNVNINAAATGLLISDGFASPPLSTILTAVQCGGGTGDGFQVYAGSSLQATACLAVTMGGFGWRLRNAIGSRFVNCSARNNGKNGVLIDTGSGATGSYSWIGGEVVGNGTANANTWEGFAAGAAATHFQIIGVSLGQFGTWSNTQTYGLTITGAADYYTVLGNDFGTNINGPVVDNGTGTHRNVDYSTIRRESGTATPAVGYHNLGDFVENTNPTVAGTAGSQYVILGWVCTTAGNPGTWTPCRTLTGT